MKFKRLISLFVAFMLILSLLAGCSGGDPDRSDDDEKSGSSHDNGSYSTDVDDGDIKDDTDADGGGDTEGKENSVDSDDVGGSGNREDPKGDNDANGIIPGTTGNSVTPLFWHVTNDEGAEMWLLGSIHLGDERIYEMPSVIMDNLKASDALAVEFDIVAFENDFDAMVSALYLLAYTDGSVISDHISPELYEQAVEVLDSYGYYNYAYDYYIPAFWSDLISSCYMEETDEVSSEYGIDRFFIQTAYDNNIEVLDIESAELQYGMMASYSPELQELLLEDSLSCSAEEYCADIIELYELWLQGDFDGLTEALTSEDYTDYTPEEIALIEEYNDAMLYQRNLGMADAAVEYLESDDVVFFVVGLAHMLGDKGIVQLLIDDGYTVELVTY